MIRFLDVQSHSSIRGSDSIESDSQRNVTQVRTINLLRNEVKFVHINLIPNQ